MFKFILMEIQSFFQLIESPLTSLQNNTYVMLSCPAKPVSPYFLAITPAMRPQTARSTLYIFVDLEISFSYSIASDICEDKSSSK